MRITWSKPSPDVLYYIVKYTKEGWNHWTERNKTGSLLTFELRDLEPGKYTVQLIAVNEYGESSPSENKTFTISPAFTISPSGKILINIVSSPFSTYIFFNGFFYIWEIFTIVSGSRHPLW